MSNILSPNQSLNHNQALFSSNGKWELILQNDGNLVIYRRENMHPTWATGTNGQDVWRAVMQTDGNLVLYAFNGHPVWASNTVGQNGAYLIMQDDGNLVIYKPTVPVWASGTNQP